MGLGKKVAKAAARGAGKAIAAPFRTKTIYQSQSRPDGMCFCLKKIKPNQQCCGKVACADKLRREMGM